MQEAPFIESYGKYLNYSQIFADEKAIGRIIVEADSSSHFSKGRRRSYLEIGPSVAYIPRSLDGAFDSVYLVEVDDTYIAFNSLWAQAVRRRGKIEIIKGTAKNPRTLKGVTADIVVAQNPHNVRWRKVRLKEAEPPVRMSDEETVTDGAVRDVAIYTNCTSEGGVLYHSTASEEGDWGEFMAAQGGIGLFSLNYRRFLEGLMESLEKAPREAKYLLQRFDVTTTGATENPNKAITCIEYNYQLAPNTLKNMGLMEEALRRCQQDDKYVMSWPQHYLIVRKLESSHPQQEKVKLVHIREPAELTPAAIHPHSQEFLSLIDQFKKFGWK